MANGPNIFQMLLVKLFCIIIDSIRDREDLLIGEPHHTHASVTRKTLKRSFSKRFSSTSVFSFCPDIFLNVFRFRPRSSRQFVLLKCVSFLCFPRCDVCLNSCYHIYQKLLNLPMHSNITIKHFSWLHFSWATLYATCRMIHSCKVVHAKHTLIWSNWIIFVAAK